jgi:hypothetical protein
MLINAITTAAPTLSNPVTQGQTVAASRDKDSVADSASVTISALALQLGSTDSTSVRAALDVLSPVAPKARTTKTARPPTLLDVDAFRVMRAKLSAALRGEKQPHLADVVAAAKKTAET